MGKAKSVFTGSAKTACVGAPLLLTCGFYLSNHLPEREHLLIGEARILGEVAFGTARYDVADAVSGLEVDAVQPDASRWKAKAAVVAGKRAKGGVLRFGQLPRNATTFCDAASGPELTVRRASGFALFDRRTVIAAAVTKIAAFSRNVVAAEAAPQRAVVTAERVGLKTVVHQAGLAAFGAGKTSAAVTTRHCRTPWML